MELRHLIYFEAVARHQHVSHAAAELAVAQPAVSKQIHDLERELGGVALFDRVGRNVRLTEAGQALLEHVRIILAQVEAARAEMRERIELQSGRASIGAPPSVGVQLLPRVLAAFNQRYPNLELVLREGGTQTMLGLLEIGEVDLAVVTLPVARHALRVTPMFTEELVIVVSPARWQMNRFCCIHVATACAIRRLRRANRLASRRAWCLMAARWTWCYGWLRPGWESR